MWLIGWFFVVEYAEFFFASVVEDSFRMCLEFVLLGCWIMRLYSSAPSLGFSRIQVGDMPFLSLNDATRFFDVKGEILKEVEVTLISESSVVNKVGWDSFHRGRQDQSKNFSSGSA